MKIAKIDIIFEKLLDGKKWIFIASAALLLALCLLLFIDPNPLVREPSLELPSALVLSDDGSRDYEFYKYSIVCSHEKIRSLTEKQYIRFLKDIVEGYADEVGVLLIRDTEENDTILYLNGDSSRGYYVNSDYENGAYSVPDGRCTLKGIIRWNGTSLSYEPQPEGTRLMDVVSVISGISEKYKIYR